jgi:hypothetical protein
VHIPEKHALGLDPRVEAGFPKKDMRQRKKSAAAPSPRPKARERDQGPRSDTRGEVQETADPPRRLSPSTTAAFKIAIVDIVDLVRKAARYS